MSCARCWATRPGPTLACRWRRPPSLDGLEEAIACIDAGAGAIRVVVPPSRELAEQSARSGAPVEPWRAMPGSRGGLGPTIRPASPSRRASQRALAVLRSALDDAGARQGRYVRLVTDTPALAAPDQAVVAAFERIDLVLADPIREIVSGRVDPDRALADHAFAHRLLLRAGTRVVVPAGPLVVAADLAAGVPSDTATRSGRALALQALTVALAVADGLPRDAVVVGALPEWLGDEPGAPARAMAEVALRRALFPGHRLAFLEPPGSDEQAVGWQALVAGILPDAGDVDLLLCRPAGGFVERAGIMRAAATVAAAIAKSRTTSSLAGLAVTHRDATLAAAEAALTGLETGGWGWLVDEPLGMGLRLGADAVAQRTSGFDPLAPDAVTGG